MDPDRTGLIAFLDTETVTLAAGHDTIWDIGLILRDVYGMDKEYRWQIRPNMARADPKSLQVCRFAERFEIADGNTDALVWLLPDAPGGISEPFEATRDAVARNLVSLLKHRHIVGAVPNFDTERLSLFCRAQGELVGLDPWHYHLIDVETLAAGFLSRHTATTDDGETHAVWKPPSTKATRLPWDSEPLSRAVGVEPPPPSERHTALGDARWARDIYDAVMGNGR